MMLLIADVLYFLLVYVFVAGLAKLPKIRPVKAIAVMYSVKENVQTIINLKTILIYMGYSAIHYVHLRQSYIIKNEKHCKMLSTFSPVCCFYIFHNRFKLVKC